MPGEREAVISFIDADYVSYQSYASYLRTHSSKIKFQRRIVPKFNDLCGHGLRLSSGPAGGGESPSSAGASPHACNGDEGDQHSATTVNSQNVLAGFGRSASCTCSRSSPASSRLG
jgi:hypothetical protein